MNHCLFKAKDTKGAVGNTVDYSSLTFMVSAYFVFGKGQILRPTPNTAPLICGACYNTQPEDLLTMA